MIIYYGGNWVYKPHTVYKGGKVKRKCGFDLNTVSYFDLKGLLKDWGYMFGGWLWCKSINSNGNFVDGDKGLLEIIDDAKLLELSKEYKLQLAILIFMVAKKSPNGKEFWEEDILPNKNG